MGKVLAICISEKKGTLKTEIRDDCIRFDFLLYLGIQKGREPVTDRSECSNYTHKRTVFSW